MKLLLFALFVAAAPLGAFGQSPAQKPPAPQHPSTPASQEITTEQIAAPTQVPPITSTQTNLPGRLEPEQVKALAHKIWLAQFRLNDLLAQVHPEKWKMPPEAQKSFDQSLDSLRKALAAEEEWRSQFEARPDSLYLGFQTYVAISAVLPRVDGVAHSVSHYENASFGAQYSQSANQLFDLQQAIEPHLAFLLKNQDNVLVVAQSNLASCENQLNTAMSGKQAPAIPMKNITPEFKGHGRAAHAKEAPAASTGERKSGTPAKTGTPKRKSGTKPASTTQK